MLPNLAPNIPIDYTSDLPKVRRGDNLLKGEKEATILAMASLGLQGAAEVESGN